MIPVSEAIRIIGRETKRLNAEAVRIESSVGRVLAEGIVADTDLPPFDRSQMDGFAVRARDTAQSPATLKVVGESAAGSGWHGRLKRGETTRIMTGAPVPEGADAVQKIELTSSETGQSVEILEPTVKGRFIVRKGSEIRKGETVIRRGEVITLNMVAALAAFGFAKVSVSIRPKVAIISTGSEIVDIAKTPGRDQIRNSNSVMLKAFAERFAAKASILPMIKDDIDRLKTAISRAVGTNDILILTGGVSVGKYDFTKTALEELGAEIFFDKLALKPGKPAVFAKLSATHIFGLPGNPVSAAVTFYLFVRRFIMQLQNAADPGPRYGYAVAGERAKGTAERDVYLPAMLETDKTGRLIATPVKWLGSSDLVGFAGAECLIVIPKGTVTEKGQPAEIVYF